MRRRGLFEPIHPAETPGRAGSPHIRPTVQPGRSGTTDAVKDYGTVILSAPEMFDIVAVMTALPLAMLVTRPVDDTVATDGFDDVQVAVLLTASTAPLDKVATATNCDVEPTGGTVPVTEIDNTEVGAVGELPHPTTDRPRIRIKLEKRTDRNDT